MQEPLFIVSNGMRVRDPADGAIYLMIDDKLRHIPNPETYNNLFKNWTSIIEITAADAYPVGQPLTKGAYLANGGSDGRVFLIIDGTKRWITSPSVFDMYGFSWGAIRTLPLVQLAVISFGPNIQISGSIISNGMRVRDPADGAVYLMIDSKLRHIPNPETYNNLFKDWTSVVAIITATVHPVGEPLTDGAYLASGTPDGKTFFIADNTKRWITSPSIFDIYGFNRIKVRQLMAAQLHAIPDGTDI